MCGHNKGTYDGYVEAQRVVKDYARRARRLGRSRGEALEVYRCPRCHRFLVFRPRFRDKARPYSRAQARRDERRLILECVVRSA